MRNTVGVNHGWGNESALMSAPSTLGIPGGAAVIFTKQATTLPDEGNTPSAGTTAQAIHMVLMGGNLILQNTVREGNIIGGGTGTTVEPTAGQQQGAERGGTGWSELTEAVKISVPASTT